MCPVVFLEDLYLAVPILLFNRIECSHMKQSMTKTAYNYTFRGFCFQPANGNSQFYALMHTKRLVFGMDMVSFQNGGASFSANDTGGGKLIIYVPISKFLFPFYIIFSLLLFIILAPFLAIFFSLLFTFKRHT